VRVTARGEPAPERERLASRAGIAIPASPACAAELTPGRTAAYSAASLFTCSAPPFAFFPHHWTSCFRSSPMAGRAVSDPAGFRKSTEAFFDEHCYDCHETGKTKGGLNLERRTPPRSPDPSKPISGCISTTALRAARCLRPRSRNPRAPRSNNCSPSCGRASSKQIAPGAKSSSAGSTAWEYENTVRDLFGIGKRTTISNTFSPRISRAGGFDNNGDALAISTEQMQGYLTRRGRRWMRPSSRASGQRRRRGRPTRCRK